MKRMGYSLASVCLLLWLLAGAALAEPAWVETEKGSLNVRSKANAKSTVVSKVPNGSRVEVLETKGDWTRIEYNGKKGYVKSSFLKDEPPESTSEEAGEVLVIQEGGYARIVTQSGALNVRKKADSKSVVVTQVPNGARVELVEATLQWSSIVYQGKTGYVQTQYLALDSQMIGSTVYPDGAYLYVRKEESALSQSVTAVCASQPMTILEIGEQWVRVSCQNGEGAAIEGYVSMADISQWRETPAVAAQTPVYAQLELSKDALRLGEELDAVARGEEGASCAVRVLRDGKVVMDARTVASGAAFSYRPRKSGVYQMELIVRRADGASIGYEARFTVEEGSTDAEAPEVYSQKDGWWLDKKYSRSNLDQSGCAIFALSHALQRLGKASEKTVPDALARTYPMYLAESGTVTSNLLAAAGRDFGFSTDKDKLYDAGKIAQRFEEGAVFSFAIVSGHIALAAGLDEDGTMVRIVDSAPSATFERIENAQLFIEDGRGGYQAVASLGEIPGAKYYLETDQFGGLEYYLTMEYVAGRGVRSIIPR